MKLTVIKCSKTAKKKKKERKKTAFMESRIFSSFHEGD
jgi:hypothetical protein